MQYVQRYNIPIIIYFIPLIIFFFKHNNWHVTYKKTITLILTILLILNATYNYYHNYFKYPKESEFKSIANILLKNKTYNGYSGFWTANTLTELSDGKIDVWVWNDCLPKSEDLSGVHSIDQTYQWLQKKTM